MRWWAILGWALMGCGGSSFESATGSIDAAGVGGNAGMLAQGQREASTPGAETGGNGGSIGAGGGTPVTGDSGPGGNHGEVVDAGNILDAALERAASEGSPGPRDTGPDGPLSTGLVAESVFLGGSWFQLIIRNNATDAPRLGSLRVRFFVFDPDGTMDPSKAITTENPGGGVAPCVPSVSLARLDNPTANATAYLEFSCQHDEQGVAGPNDLKQLSVIYNAAHDFTFDYSYLATDAAVAAPNPHIVLLQNGWVVYGAPP